jgi:hypothetical protein
MDKHIEFSANELQNWNNSDAMPVVVKKFLQDGSVQYNL